MENDSRRLVALMLVLFLGGQTAVGQEADVLMPEGVTPVFPWAGQDAALPWPDVMLTKEPGTQAIAEDIGQQYNPANFNGVWRAKIRSIHADYPMTEAGQAIFAARQSGSHEESSKWNLDATEDPYQDCNPAGMPRVLDINGAFEFAYLPGRIVQFFEWSRTWRDVWMDGRSLPEDPDPRWLGYSVGRWEGDVLVIETIGLEDRAWLDFLGKPQGYNTHIEERWRRVNFNTLQLDIVLSDPELYQGEIKFEQREYRLQPLGDMREVFCAPLDVQQFYDKVENPAHGSDTSQGAPN